MPKSSKTAAGSSTSVLLCVPNTEICPLCHTLLSQGYGCLHLENVIMCEKKNTNSLGTIPSKLGYAPRQFKHLHGIAKCLPGRVRHTLNPAHGQGPAKPGEPRPGLSAIWSQTRDDDGTRNTPGWVVAEPLQAAPDGSEVLTKLYGCASSSSCTLVLPHFKSLSRQD